MPRRPLPASRPAAPAPPPPESKTGAAAGVEGDAEGGVEAGAETGAAAGVETVAVAGLCGGGWAGGGWGSVVTAVACGDAGGEFCRAIAPVTESSPCSSAVTREYSRSRSLFSVSIADASRRASFWLSLARDWICCDCRAESAAAACSRRPPIDDWLVMMATITAPTEMTPHAPNRNSDRRSKFSSSAKKPLRKPPVFSVSKPPARWSVALAIGRYRPSRALAES